jgi:hypothetical protein
MKAKICGIEVQHSATNPLGFSLQINYQLIWSMSPKVSSQPVWSMGRIHSISLNLLCHFVTDKCRRCHSIITLIAFCALIIDLIFCFKGCILLCLYISYIIRQNTTQIKYVLSPPTVLCYMFRLLGAIIRQNTINLFQTIELHIT